MKLAKLHTPRNIWDIKQPGPLEHIVTDVTGVPQDASELEWNVAQAANELKLRYYFQVNFFWGREVLGGMVVDFVFITVPRWSPVSVLSKYYHRGAQKEKDILQANLLYKYLGGELNLLKFFEEDDVATVELAKAEIRKQLL